MSPGRSRKPSQLTTIPPRLMTDHLRNRKKNDVHSSRGSCTRRHRYRQNGRQRRKRTFVAVHSLRSPRKRCDIIGGTNIGRRLSTTATDLDIGKSIDAGAIDCSEEAIHSRTRGLNPEPSGCFHGLVKERLSFTWFVAYVEFVVPKAIHSLVGRWSASGHYRYTSNSGFSVVSQERFICASPHRCSRCLFEQRLSLPSFCRCGVSLCAHFESSGKIVVDGVMWLNLKHVFFYRSSIIFPIRVLVEL